MPTAVQARGAPSTQRRLQHRRFLLGSQNAGVLAEFRVPILRSFKGLNARNGGVKARQSSIKAGRCIDKTRKPRAREVAMPKKSRRRANKASGGSSGRAVGGGAGADTAADDANKGAAKIFDHENNYGAAGGDDAGGILTAGAVTMFARCGDMSARAFQRKEAPILQISEEICVAKDKDFPLFSFVVSDGDRCMTACLHLDKDTHCGGAWKIITEKKAVLYSAIRLLQCFTF